MAIQQRQTKVYVASIPNGSLRKGLFNIVCTSDPFLFMEKLKKAFFFMILRLKILLMMAFHAYNSLHQCLCPITMVCVSSICPSPSSSCGKLSSVDQFSLSVNLWPFIIPTVFLHIPYRRDRPSVLFYSTW